MAGARTPRRRGWTLEALTFDPRLTQYKLLSQTTGRLPHEDGLFQVIVGRC